MATAPVAAYTYLSCGQGFQPAEKLAATVGLEYGTLVGSPEDDGHCFQGVLTSSYDITNERSLGARLIARADGVTGYAAYRQVVRRAWTSTCWSAIRTRITHFSPRVMVKLIRTM